MFVEVPKYKQVGRNRTRLGIIYKGAVGKVIEIVFKENESTLDGTHPQYIVVDFLQYRGPAWINEKPTRVPIPPIELACHKHCCNLRYIPLSLS
jgi:hypothetical protein